MVVRLSALRTGRFLTPGNTPGTHFCQGHSAMGRIMSMTPSGIETATFRSVAQPRNHCATAVPTSTLEAAIIFRLSQMIGHFIIKKQPNLQPLRTRRENNS